MFGGSFGRTCRCYQATLGEDPIDDRIYGFGDRRRQRRPDIEPFAFDEIGDEMARQPVHAARQFHRLGHAESMGGTAGKSIGKRAAGEIETMDPARPADRRRRIDDDDRGVTVPLLDQGEDIAAALDDLNPGRHSPMQPRGDRRPETVVTAIRIADGGDEHT
jgi:hypothetical protein